MQIFDISEGNLEKLTACPICNSNDITRVASVKDANELEFFTTDFCNNCSFVFRAVRPTKSWFSEAFVNREAHQKKENFQPINSKIEEERYSRYSQLGKALAEGINFQNEARNILDIGCGPGTGLSAFADCGFVAEGIDEDATRANYGISKGLNIRITPWEEFKPEKKYDIITMLHCTEHFHDPKPLLIALKDWLTPEGKLVIEVPNFKYYVESWVDALYLAHMANYTPLRLASLVVECGYPVPQRISYYSDSIKNDENLCFVFDMKHPGKWEDIPTTDEADLLTVKQKYRNGLDAHELKMDVLSFQVPCINDVSLGYKNSSIISSNLRENLQMREVSTTNDTIIIS